MIFGKRYFIIKIFIKEFRIRSNSLNAVEMKKRITKLTESNLILNLYKLQN